MGYEMNWLRCGCVLAVIVTLLSWANARNPYRYERIAFQPENGPRRHAVIVRPRSGSSQTPAIIFATYEKATEVELGKRLQAIASAGTLAIGIPLAESANAIELITAMTLSPSFNRLMNGSPACILATSGAAAELAELLLRGESPHVDLVVCAPSDGALGDRGQRLVRTQGKWPFQGHVGALSSHASNRPRVLFIDPVMDERAPVDRCRRAMEMLESHTEVLRYIQKWNVPDVEAGTLAYLRVLSEACISHANWTYVMPTRNVSTAGRQWLVICCLSAAAWLMLTASVHLPASWPYCARVVAMIICICTICAVVVKTVTVHGKPEAVGILAMRMTRNEVSEEDVQWLIKEASAGGEHIAGIIDDASVAGLQRSAFHPHLNTEFYRSAVLSPVIGGYCTAAGWRRPLWEFMWPIVRREKSSIPAAVLVGYSLRRRQTVVDAKLATEGVTHSWERGYVDEVGFRRLYVASLRAVGIASRIGHLGDVEILGSSGWRPAPLVPLGEMNAPGILLKVQLNTP